MYQHILVPLDHSPTDEVVLSHIRKLARFTGAKLTLIHVAEGHAARNYEQLNLAPSPEIASSIVASTDAGAARPNSPRKVSPSARNSPGANLQMKFSRLPSASAAT